MRRSSVAAGIILLCSAAFLALELFCGGIALDRCIGGRTGQTSFADCRARGFPLSGSGALCTLHDGRVLRADDRIVFSDPRLPFSFSYLSSLTRTLGRRGQVAVFSGQQGTMEVLLVARSGDGEAALRAAFPAVFTGSLTVARSAIDPRHNATVVLPSHATGTGAIGLAAVPLHPPVSYGGRVYDFVLFHATVPLLQQVIASLAFAPPPPVAPQNFIDPVFTQ